MSRWLFIFLFYLVGCSRSFEPLPASDPILPMTTHWIEQLSSLVGQGPIGGPLVICGVVSSSDSCSNFYKQLIIEDPTGAVELRIGLYDLWARFHRWDRVSVQLQGLAVGRYQGMLQVGYAGDFPDSVEPITSWTLLNMLAMPHGVYAPLDPLVLDVDQVKACHTGLFVELSGGHFTQGGLKSWAGEQLYSTSYGHSITVFTNPYATFASKLLPKGKVTLRGVVTQYKGQLQIKICSTADVF
ncbi:MAG: DUF5689 domain-containing protein [Mucinivorans sp.]